MTVGSKILGRLTGLPPAQVTAVSVDRDLEAKMPDGIVLFADRWYPSEARGDQLPIVLIRTPYGRRQMGAICRLFAERGYQVVIQSCRGTFGSTGDFVPFQNEREDGQATLEWLSAQPWFSGMVGTFGASYLGLTQWALAREVPEFVRAMALGATCSNFRQIIYPGESFFLDTALSWIYQIHNQERGALRVIASHIRGSKALRPAFNVFPLAAADQAVVGRPVPFYRDWLEHDQPGDPWWSSVDFSKDTATVPAPSLVVGWYDMFLPFQLADYEALRASGRSPRLTIGPWTHTSPSSLGAMLREAMACFDAQLRGGSARLSEAPVRLYVMGAKRWVELPDWPPPARVELWHLHSEGRLAAEPPLSSGSDHYRYDPADPTPSVGGSSLNFRNNGAKNNRALEARPDVLCYTSQALSRDLTVAGPLFTRLHLRSSVDHTDFFVRLCDVWPNGRSVNISDGMVRVKPGLLTKATDGSFSLRIPMWSTATTFKHGHRLRLQISSGAHPMYARNPGTGEHLGVETHLAVADQEVFHEPARPSALELPITDVL